MKKLLYTFVALTTLVTTSCSDMLEEVNYGSPTVEDMMTQEENVVLLVGQIYADLNKNRLRDVYSKAHPRG